MPGLARIEQILVSDVISGIEYDAFPLGELPEITPSGQIGIRLYVRNMGDETAYLLWKILDAEGVLSTGGDEAVSVGDAIWFVIPSASLPLMPQEPVPLTIEVGSKTCIWTTSFPSQRICSSTIWDDFKSFTVKPGIGGKELPKPTPSRMIVRLDADKLAGTLEETFNLFGLVNFPAIIKTLPVPWVSVMMGYTLDPQAVVGDIGRARTNLYGRYELPWKADRIGSYVIQAKVFGPLLQLKLAESNYIVVSVT